PGSTGRRSRSRSRRSRSMASRTRRRRGRCRPWPSCGNVMSDGRYSRNKALFGPEGQEKIAATKVTIIGVGGLGSHVAQQLAYLGVETQTPVDFDIVTISSMNRLVGAVDTDVAAKTKKVIVAER